MKAFKINRNSWHYKLNKHFFNADIHWMERSWEPSHNNFCAYWRATVFRICIASMLAAVSITALVGTAYLTYMHPIEALKIVGVTLGVLAFIVGVAMLSVKVEAMREAKRLTTSNSLLLQRYRVYKSKICPMIEYDE